MNVLPQQSGRQHNGKYIENISKPMRTNIAANELMWYMMTKTKWTNK
jgi:hypothetical protein